MAGRRTKSSCKQIAALKHKDKRKNIPTEELRDFVKEAEQKPKDVVFPGLLYARDPSLDPQLVWKGKDEQDRTSLTVPSIPIYIQEKIHPHAIIENLRAESKRAKPDDQLQFFSDFNGIPFEDLIDFYHHDANWANRMILGDSLLVMTSLAEKERLKGQVQMIYIDPPYGIEFNSNWQVSTRKRDVKDGKAEDFTRQPEQVRAFRDTWELGIHSYLSYLRDRLVVARELLTESGSVFVQIGDKNVHLVRCLMDEVLGVENFISIIYFRKKTMPLGATYLENMGDYILWYAKDKIRLKYRQLYISQSIKDDFHWNWYENSDGKRIKVSKAQIASGVEVPKDAKVTRLVSMWPPTFNANAVFRVTWHSADWLPPNNQCWPTNPSGMERLVRANRLDVEGKFLRYILCLSDYDLVKITSAWTDTIGARDQQYVVETSASVVERCLLMTTDPGDLVLDPTCGSGTTACVAEQWGRRWITIDTSRVALALARTRLMAGRYPYYILADSPEGVQKEAEITGKLPPDYKTEGDIRKGFVCKQVPHIKLKSIANNEEIDEIHVRYQPGLDKLRAAINKMLKQKWEEWEIPREAESKWSKDARDLLKDWWELRRKRQGEIDASISKNADPETLVDQPYEDKKRIRVAGPFTVESLSPHRTLSVAKKKDLKEKGIEGWRIDFKGAGEFGNIIIENLKKTGVQNTRKNERLKFDRLEPYAETWIHAEGEYTEKDGKARRAGVCIGPEHGTVGPELIKEAAKEAVKGRGFDLLIVCGFAFDPHVSEEVKRYGELMILPVRMNPDLSMGEDLLKKTGAGNLFMVFGEPDIDIKKGKDGKISVTIKGLDIYDPTTGQIRSNSTDDIACWFIDTNYNEESFFVRHAYFTGGDQPYEKLQRSLRAEINEAAWSSLYSTTSRPFDPPKTGKIAVKVINHYGDEVLKVYENKSK